MEPDIFSYNLYCQHLSLNPFIGSGDLQRAICCSRNRLPVHCLPMVLYQACKVSPNFLHLMEFYCYYYITVFITTEFDNTPKIHVSLYNTVHVSCPTSLTFSVGKITVQCSPFNLQLDIIPFSSYTFCVHSHLWILAQITLLLG